MDIRKSHFELFELPTRYAVDALALEAAYRRLQMQVHPDRFADGSAAEKRVALQWATHVNGAFKTLRDPLQRAAYMCARRGIDVFAAGDGGMTTGFLMTQMETREALEEARDRADAAALEQLAGANRLAICEQVAQIGRLLDDVNDIAAACAATRELMFLYKLGEEIDAALELIEV